MAVRACRKQFNSSLTCEAFEKRQLLSADLPAAPAADVRAVARAGPLDKAPSLFIEPQAGRGPIIQAINAARSQTRVEFYSLCAISRTRWSLCSQPLGIPSR